MKKFYFLLAILFCSPAWAMRTPMFSGGSGGNTPSTSATNYIGFNSDPVATNDTTVRTLIASNGIIEGLYVSLSTNPGAAASGKKYTYTLEKNGSDTSITCQILETATSCSDTTHTVSVTAGDNISVKVTPTSTPTAAITYTSTIFNSGSNGPSIIYSSAANTSPSTSATVTQNVMGRISWAQASNKTLIPTSGTISSLYVSGDVAPGSGGSGKSYAITILKNSVATALTCTLLETATTCNYTSGSFSVVPTDQLTVQSVPANTPTASKIVIGLVFTPTIDGESIYSNTYGGGSPSASADRYALIGGYSAGYATVEANVQFVSPRSDVVANKLYFLGTATGSGKSMLLGLRVNSATSSLTCTATNASSCNNQTTRVSLSSGDKINFIFSPSNTPTVGSVNVVSMSLYIDPNDKIYGGAFYA